MKDVSIIVPVYNEEENIEQLMNYLNEHLKDYENIEVIFVDDGSVDNSFELLKQYNNNVFKKVIIKLSKNCGSHIALRAGISNASNDICTFFSADLQEPFSVITDMYKKIKEGAEIVFAYKNSVKRSWIGKVFSKIYANLMKKFVDKKFPNEGINNVMFNKKAKDVLNKNIEKNSSIYLQILTLGFKQEFVSYDLQKRNKGKSKWTLSKKVKLLLDSFFSFSYFPIRLVSCVGVLLFLLGIIWNIEIIINKIISVNYVPIGYSTIEATIILGFGVVNISIGIIAEYLWRTLDKTLDRPAFIVDEIIK